MISIKSKFTRVIPTNRGILKEMAVLIDKGKGKEMIVVNNKGLPIHVREVVRDRGILQEACHQIRTYPHREEEGSVDNRGMNSRPAIPRDRVVETHRGIRREREAVTGRGIQPGPVVVADFLTETTVWSVHHNTRILPKLKMFRQEQTILKNMFHDNELQEEGI